MKPAAAPGRRLPWLFAALAAGYAPLALNAPPVVMFPLAVLSGLSLPPLLTCTFVLIDQLAPAGTVTEAFAWLVTAFLVGSSAGSALAGVLVDAASPAVSFAIGAAFSAVAAVVAIGRFRAADPATGPLRGPPQG